MTTPSEFMRALDPEPPRRGPWFTATYDQDCDGCGDRISEGDTIRADGEGGWEGQECCGDDEDDHGFERHGVSGYGL